MKCERGAVTAPLFCFHAVILLLSIVGAQAVNNSLTIAYFMPGFGVMGYFMTV